MGVLVAQIGFGFNLLLADLAGDGLLFDVLARDQADALAITDRTQAESSGRFCHSCIPSSPLSLIVKMVVLETSAP